MSTKTRTERATLLAQLPQPSSAYKRRVWLALGGVLVFLTLYFVLAGWLLYTAYRVTVGADSLEFAGCFVGACALFLAVMMLKPVFFVKHGDPSGCVEIKPEEQPRLFAYLYELADAAEAPRPHRVFLSPQVNAAVFYDLSALNLIFPSKKNLEIGLALVNALSLGEFRAVLAHEFGHFSQRSMAVMRWVYLAQQIAGHLVMRRDKLDALLVQLSQLDPRIGWVGWILSLIVWSIRSLVDTAFAGVVVLQRALSREMEFQADLVAVALTGSDALVHALHRLQAADDSWDRTLSLVGEDHANGRIARDVFPLHARVIERMGSILSDPEYGKVPPLPPDRPENHRLFKPDLAQPPRMWLTHPLNHERETNAKRRYVPASIDARSAWTLFDDPVSVCEKVSALMLESAGKETAPLDASIESLERAFGREYLDSRYRGIYLGRSIVRAVERPEMLLEPAPPDWRQQLDHLYPATLTDDVTRLRALENELGQLRAVQSGQLKPAEGVIRHRGRTIKRRELPKVIEELSRAAASIEQRLAAGDRRRRSVHLAAATELGQGWAPYLQGLLAALHYADHTAANIRDLQGVLAHAVHIASATHRVSSSDRKKVLAMASELHQALASAFAQRHAVVLDSALAERMPGAVWAEQLGEFGLPAPNDEQLGDWLNVIDGWVSQIAAPCVTLRNAALEQLLITEAYVAEHARGGTPASTAPAPALLPATYTVLLAGKERERKSTLNAWQRFQLADGVVPTLARVAAAAAIVAGVLGFGNYVGTATITVYNGLAIPVVVTIDGRDVPIGAFGHHAQDVGTGAIHRIETRTRQGKVIEAFAPEIPGSFANFVYSVAGASPLVEWTAVYGNVAPEPERMIGAPRWTRSAADLLFDKPPESISSKSGGARRTVLSALVDASPNQQLTTLATAADRQRVIAAHARWDATSSKHILYWMAIAEAMLPSFRDIVAARLVEAPRDIVLLRLEHDEAPPAKRDSVCNRHRAMSAAAPDDVGLQYLASRCLSDRAARAQAYRADYARWPDDGWIAYAAGYVFADAAEWRAALTALETARVTLRPLSMHVAVDLARIHRLVDGDSAAALVTANLSRISDELEYLTTLETGHGVRSSSPVAAYAELARGRLVAAIARARADSNVAARVLRLAAASDGATPEIEAQALALGDTVGINNDTRWSAIAVAARAGRDYDRFLPDAQTMPSDELERLTSFVDQLRRGKRLDTVEKTLNGLRPELRGHAYSMGVVVLGAKAPREWRHAANRLLFASERPYLRD